MHYSKRPLTIEEQINRLEQRGLFFSDKTQAGQYLKNISYYRLRAYTYPFQDNCNPCADHKFLRNNIDFKDIVDLYVFDRRLRNLVFNELEKIEIALRSQLSLVYSVRHQDPFWYLDKNRYNKLSEIHYWNLMRDVENDVNRSNEDFIKHFKTKYDAPPMPQIFVLLSAIKYIVDIISPGNSFKKNLKRLLDDEHQLLTLKEMGFPEDWDLLPVWMW